MINKRINTLMSKTDLIGLPLTELSTFVQNTLGAKPYRAKQLFQWLYRRRVTDITLMTDLSKDFRQLLSEEAEISQLRPIQKLISSDGTRKYLFQLEDGESIESVMIPGEDRLTVCISSQVGCAMGCKYCLTGKMGFKRNLSSAEIVNQVLAVELDLTQDPPLDEAGQPLLPKEHGTVERYLSHVVMMGMGEPMMNLPSVLAAIHVLTDHNGYNLAPRRMTVSTVGLVPKVEEFIAANTGVRLAISLTAGSNELRNQLLPINQKYPLEKLLPALKNYPTQNRKPITFEYVMLAGVNDRAEDARALIKQIHDLECKVNLIPLNESPEIEYRRPSDESVMEFQRILWDARITATVRESRGRDILAACGQLKTQTKKNSSCN